jgi:formate/nitrite transporter FocA (FNT family)
MIVRNLIPSTLGNIVGGMVMVGMSYWFVYLRNPGEKAPAKPGRKKKK